MEYVTVQGVEFPAIGFGTAWMEGKACRDAVEDALDLRYRHIVNRGVTGWLVLLR
jgi:diketogulonate reductase-like aldo/keto reductase